MQVETSLIVAGAGIDVGLSDRMGCRSGYLDE